jgi:BASS family bile acid:Na+ symporter
MEEAVPIDEVMLNFNPASLKILNVVIALIMFGVALDTRLGDFTEVLKKPKGPVVGLCCQFLILPATAYLIAEILNPAPSIKLGIILVASCPGGNLSNFLTGFSGGNAALSIAMSSISTLCSIIMTPLNFGFWGSLNPQTAAILKKIYINPVDIMITILVMLIIPSVLGIAVTYKKPFLAKKMQRPFKIASMVIFTTFLLGALAANWQHFLNYVGLAFFIVFFTNALGYLLGFYIAKAWKLPYRDQKAVAFEVGIQNAGFTLILIFNFFNGLGGMALIASWWGIWHMVTGLSLGVYWAKKYRKHQSCLA